MPKRNIIKFILLLIVIGTCVYFVKFSPWSAHISKDSLLSFFREIQSNWWGPIVFILVYGVGCVFAVPGSLLTPLGGAIFGVARGFIYNLIAANLGACLAFGMARFMGRDFIQSLMRGKKIAQFDDRVRDHGFATILRLRLIPLVPFNGLNFGSGFSGVRFRDYFWGSVLGMIPGCFIYTYFGDALLSGVQEASRKAFLNLAIAGALLIALSFLPALYKRKVQKL